MSHVNKRQAVILAGIVTIGIVTLVRKVCKKKSRKQPYGTIWMDEDFGKPGSVFFVGSSRCTWS